MIATSAAPEISARCVNFLIIFSSFSPDIEVTLGPTPWSVRNSSILAPRFSLFTRVIRFFLDRF